MQIAENGSPERLAYRVDDACKAIGISRSKLYELVKSNELRIVRVGGRSVIPASALMALLEGGAA